MILMLGSISGMAGHDLMVHLAIHHQGPFGEENVPARFGVPLPWTEDPVPLDQMVLVGAESAQMRPVLYWPNGSIRWMLVDAILGVNPSQDRAAFQLTTGEQAPASTSIGRITDSKLEMHSGAVIVKTLGSVDGAVVLALEDVSHGTVAKIRFPFPAEVVPSSTDFVWSWDYNGPVAASMRLHHPFDWKGASFVHTIRCHLFAGQEGVVVEQEVRRRVTSSDPSQDAVLFREEDATWGIPGVELPENWSSVGSQEPGVRRWRSSAGDLRAFHVNRLQRAQAAAEPLDTIQMFPGSMARERTAFVFHPSGQAPGSCIPHIGRPISVNTYHDSQWHGGFLKQGDGSLSWEDVSDPSSMSIVSERVDHLVSGSLLPTPQTMQEMDALMVGLTQKASLDSLIVTANRMRDLSAYRLFYGLTGDTSMRVLWLEGLNNPPWQPFQPARLQAFWEACVMTPPQDPSVALEGTAKATEVMEVLQNLPWESMPEEERSRLIPLLYQIGRQRGFPESKQGVWLDRMEGMIHELKSHPSQELFAVAYLLTGENVFLKQGREWLQKEGAPSEDQPLEVLIESIQRQWTWRWLPLKVSPVEDGVRVEWTVPKGVEAYRFKSSSKPIGSLPKEASSIAFYQATDRVLEIRPKAEGEKQVVVLPASSLEGDQYVAARYLERGPELPVPKVARDLASASEDTSQTGRDDQGVDPRRFWVLGILLLLAILALFGIRKKS